MHNEIECKHFIRLTNSILNKQRRKEIGESASVRGEGISRDWRFTGQQQEWQRRQHNCELYPSELLILIFFLFLTSRQFKWWMVDNNHVSKKIDWRQNKKQESKIETVKCKCCKSSECDVRACEQFRIRNDLSSLSWRARRVTQVNCIKWNSRWLTRVCFQVEFSNKESFFFSSILTRISLEARKFSAENCN